jgi:hypothetical protein
VDVIVAAILVVDHQLLEVTRDVICSARVHMPIGIDSVRGSSDRCNSLLVWRASERRIKSLEAAKDGVTIPATELADD